MSAVRKIEDVDLSTHTIVNEYCGALIADVGSTRFAEKTIANICGCGLRTARNWLERINAPDDIYKAKLIRSKHFPQFAAAHLRIAGIEPAVDPRLAHAVSYLHATFQSLAHAGAPQGSHMADPAMAMCLDEPDGFSG